MVNKHKHKKKKKSFINYGKGNKALFEKKIQKFDKNKKWRNTEKELEHFQEMQISDDKNKKSVFSLAETVESEVISSSSSE